MAWSGRRKRSLCLGFPYGGRGSGWTCPGHSKKHLHPHEHQTSAAARTHHWNIATGRLGLPQAKDDPRKFRNWQSRSHLAFWAEVPGGISTYIVCTLPDAVLTHTMAAVYYVPSRTSLFKIFCPYSNLVRRSFSTPPFLLWVSTVVLAVARFSTNLVPPRQILHK